MDITSFALGMQPPSARELKMFSQLTSMGGLHASQISSMNIESRIEEFENSTFSLKGRDFHKNINGIDDFNLMIAMTEDYLNRSIFENRVLEFMEPDITHYGYTEGYIGSGSHGSSWRSNKNISLEEKFNVCLNLGVLNNMSMEEEMLKSVDDEFDDI